MSGEDTKKETIRMRKLREQDALLKILEEMPIIEVACKRVGIGRATYYRWRQEDNNFLLHSNQATQLGRERINDMSESQLINLIKQSKMPAITLWLKNNHPLYTNKADSKFPPPAPILTEEELEDKILDEKQKSWNNEEKDDFDTIAREIGDKYELELREAIMNHVKLKP